MINLHEIAHMLTQKRVQQWFNTQPLASMAVHNVVFHHIGTKLKKDLLFSLNSNWPKDFNLPRTDHVSVELRFNYASRVIADEAELLSMEPKKFTVPRNSTLTKEIIKTLQFTEYLDSIREYKKYVPPYTNITSLGLLYDLTTYCTSINTCLNLDCAPKVIKQVIEDHKDDCEFWNGYPRDLLCHDVVSLRERKYALLGVRKGWISTQLYEDNCVSKSDKSDYDFYNVA